MTAEQKINESEYFLNQMEKANNNGVEIQYNLSAFLSACRSIPEHLLEEYNQKYSLGISTDSELNTKIFRLKSNGNKKAELFIDYFDLKLEEIKKDDIGHFLWNKRNSNTHRVTVSPNLVKIHVSLDAMVEVAPTGVFDPNTPEELMNKQLQEENQKKLRKLGQKQSNANSNVSFHFTEFPEIDVTDGCKRFLNLMRNMSSDIHSKFP